MRTLAITLIAAGLALTLIGALLYLASRFNIPLGRLPGDINVQGKSGSFHFPIVTCMLISIVLTILLNLFLRR